MEPELNIITKEIPAKGKGYFVIEKCWPDQMDTAVRRGASALLAQGATSIYVCSKDPAAALAAGEGAGYRLEFCHDMLAMERALDDTRQRAKGRLTLEPLEPAQRGAWLAMYNETFFDVPNSATYDKNTLEKVLSDGCRCGFALLGGVRVGIYELCFQEDVPRIEGIALTKNTRGLGAGRELLLTLMDALAQEGHQRVCLQVSTANETAFALYRSVGFRVSELISHWYQVIAQGDLRG